VEYTQNTGQVVKQLINRGVKFLNGDIQLKSPFESFFQFPNPATAAIYLYKPAFCFIVKANLWKGGAFANN